MGHASSNFTLEPRCVKCAQNHGKGECTLTAKRNDNTLCANCGESHVASCSKCKNLLGAAKLYSQTDVFNRRAASANINRKNEQANSNISYASQVAGERRFNGQQPQALQQPQQPWYRRLNNTQPPPQIPRQPSPQPETNQAQLFETMQNIINAFSQSFDAKFNNFFGPLQDKVKKNTDSINYIMSLINVENQNQNV